MCGVITSARSAQETRRRDAVAATFQSNQSFDLWRWDVAFAVRRTRAAIGSPNVRSDRFVESMACTDSFNAAP
jgi:hypothetical protein